MWQPVSLVEMETRYQQADLQRKLEQRRLVRRAEGGDQSWVAGLLDFALAGLGRLGHSTWMAIRSVTGGSNEPRQECC